MDKVLQALKADKATAWRRFTDLQRDAYAQHRRVKDIDAQILAHLERLRLSFCQDRPAIARGMPWTLPNGLKGIIDSIVKITSSGNYIKFRVAVADTSGDPHKTQYFTDYLDILTGLSVKVTEKEDIHSFDKAQPPAK